MKKALLFLIVLAMLVVAGPLFADVSVKPGFNFTWLGYYDPSAAAGAQMKTTGPQRVYFTLDTALDKFNNLVVVTRTNDQGAKLAPVGGTATTFWFADGGGELWNAKLVTDITGALNMGLPFTLKSTVGYFDTYFTSWADAASNGWDIYYGGGDVALHGTQSLGWPNKVITLNGGSPVACGGFQLDLGVGPATIHYFNDFQFKNLFIGADINVAGIGVNVSYGTYDTNKIAEGIFSLEANYALPDMGGFTATPNAFFRYDTHPIVAGGVSAMTYGVGLAANFSMFHLGLGFQGDSNVPLDHYFAEVSVAPMAGTKVYAGAYLDQKGTSPLQGIDIGAQYNLGVTKLTVGYVIGGTDKLVIPLLGDSGPALANGLYFGVALNL